MGLSDQNIGLLSKTMSTTWVGNFEHICSKGNDKMVSEWQGGIGEFPPYPEMLRQCLQSPEVKPRASSHCFNLKGCEGNSPASPLYHQVINIVIE